MRLIDADELIKDRVGNDLVRIAAMCAPTAYDVEKVMERLEALRSKREEQLKNCYWWEMADVLRCKMAGIVEAIEIVKEEKCGSAS